MVRCRCHIGTLLIGPRRLTHIDYVGRGVARLTLDENGSWEAISTARRGWEGLVPREASGARPGGPSGTGATLRGPWEGQLVAS